jgi:hypothetical protein
MPIREAVTDNIIPHTDATPIPVRTVTTRTAPRLAPPAAVAPQVEASTTVADSTTSAESVKLSPQLSAFARKEAAYRQRELTLKTREQELEAKLAKAERFTSLESKLASKDFSDLEGLGLTYEEYTKYLLDKQAGEPTPERQQMTKLEQEVADMKAAAAKKADEEFQATVSEYSKEIAKIVDSDPRFLSVKEYGAQEHVLQTILDAWEQDDEELSVEDAAKQVEDFIVEEGKKFTALSKFKTPEPEKKPLPPPRAGLKTLTQQVVAGASKPSTSSLSKLSDSERYAEARRRVEARKLSQG